MKRCMSRKICPVFSAGLRQPEKPVEHSSLPLTRSFSFVVLPFGPLEMSVRYFVDLKIGTSAPFQAAARVVPVLFPCCARLAVVDLMPNFPAGSVSDILS